MSSWDASLLTFVDSCSVGDSGTAAQAVLAMAEILDAAPAHYAPLISPRADADRIAELLAADAPLCAAMELVGEKGIAALTMREIANSAGIALASIYQYFPNRSAVIATLYQEVSRQTREHVAAQVAQVSSVEHILEAAYAAVDMFYERMRANPAIPDLMVENGCQYRLHQSYPIKHLL